MVSNKGFVAAMLGAALVLSAAGRIGSAAAQAPASQPEALRLVQTIPLPKSAIFDHMAVDRIHNLAFIAASANRELYIVDLKAGKWIRSVKGMGKPAGVAYDPKADRVIYSVDSGHVRFLNPKTFEVETEITLKGGADCMRWDPSSDTLYVNNGGPQLEEDSVILTTIDTKARKVTHEMSIPSGRLEFLTVEKNGPHIFINNADKSQVTVVDKVQHKIIANWDLPAKVPYPMALNEKLHRLFVVTREPSMLVVFDTETGKIVAQLPVGGGGDDLAFDTVEKRLYLSAGDGLIDVIQMKNPDTYESMARIKTRPGARTSTFVQEQGRFYLLLPAKAPETTSELRIYETIR